MSIQLETERRIGRPQREAVYREVAEEDDAFAAAQRLAR